MKEYLKKHIEWIKRDPGEWLADYYLPRVFLFLVLLTPILASQQEKGEPGRIIILILAVIVGAPILIIIFLGLPLYLADVVNQPVNISRVADELSEIKNLLSRIEEKMSSQNKEDREIIQTITNIKRLLDSQSQDKEKLENVAQLLKKIEKELSG